MLSPQIVLYFSTFPVYVVLVPQGLINFDL